MMPLGKICNLLEEEWDRDVEAQGSGCVSMMESRGLSGEDLQIVP